MAPLLIAATWLQASSEQSPERNVTPLVVAASILLVVVLVGYPALARFWAPPAAAPPRGLNLPRGSVRSMLALLVVGAFVVFAIFGVEAFDADGYQRVVTTLGTLAGPILGFYFGSRHSASRLDRGGRLPSGQAGPETDSAGDSSNTSG